MMDLVQHGIMPPPIVVDLRCVTEVRDSKTAYAARARARDPCVQICQEVKPGGVHVNAQALQIFGAAWITIAAARRKTAE